MKSLLCVCVFALAGGALGAMDLPPEFVEMLDNVQTTCEADTGISKEVVEKAKATMTLPDDKGFKCFLKCMMVHLQCMTEDGVFNADDVIASLPEQMKELGAEKVVKACANEKGSDPCDTAYHIVKCFAHESRAIGEIFTRR